MPGRRTRFAELLTKYEREIHRFTFRITGNPEDAADLLQETFLRAFRAFPRLPEDANHRAWLYRIAYRQALNLFRSRKARPTEPLEEACAGAGADSIAVADTNGGPESLNETRLLARALRRVIRDLTPRQRTALLLKKYEGLSYADVAAVLGVTPENARAHVYQAMKKVRNGLRDLPSTTKDSAREECRP
jgi:RNA polymerase sigma-70 factor (ECF subfamily)